MESFSSRQYTLAELEPGWPEDLTTKIVKSSPRMHGSMRMALRRVSRTPENSRAYAHGDPVHLIDWKAFGRTDELVVREHRDEATSRVLVVFDAGPSLQWPTKSELDLHGGVDRAAQKIDIAIRLALYLAHAHLTVGDAVTIGCIDNKGNVSKGWMPKSPADVLRVYEACRAQGFLAGLNSFMLNVNLPSTRFDVGWLLTDFLGEEFVKEMRTLSSPSDSVGKVFKTHVSRLVPSKILRVIHVFSWLEDSNQWMDGATSYRDESLGLKVYMGDQLKSSSVWSEQVKDWGAKIRLSVKELGGNYLAVNDKTAVADFLHWLSGEALVP